MTLQDECGRVLRSLESNTMLARVIDASTSSAFTFGGWIATYEALAATGSPLKPTTVRSVGADVTAVQVAPYSTLETVAMAGERVELWLEPDKAVTQWCAVNGMTSRRCAASFETQSDALSKLFGDQHVVVYKMHPNLQHSTTFISRKLIAEAFITVIEGNTAPGAALIALAAVDELLMTGGQLSCDTIVWAATPPPPRPPTRS